MPGCSAELSSAGDNVGHGASWLSKQALHQFPELPRFQMFGMGA